MSKLILPPSARKETIDLGRVLPKGNPNLKLHPLTNHVILEKAADNEQLALRESSIINPDTSKLPLVFKVLAVGDGMVSSVGNRLPMSVKVGDLVMCDLRAAVGVVHDGRECILVQDPDIKAVVK